jgi:hypothetical protein
MELRADIELSDEDRIDEILPPGVNVNPDDAGYDNPFLRPEALRR